MKKIDPVTLVLVLEAGLAPTRRNRIRARLEELGVRVRHVDGGERSYLEITGDDLPVRTLAPENWEGVAGVVPLTPGYPHASWGAGRGELVTPTTVAIGGVTIGAGTFVMIGGPCAIENADSAHRIAAAVAAAGADLFRGGAYKPRTSPYAFQGLEQEGLRILSDVRARTGLPIVTEVIDTRLIESVASCADLLQVGSRNMQNYALLKELGKIRKPVLLKRGFAATIDELLLAAEYLLSSGNDQVVLCERGIRTAAGGENVVLDLGAIPDIRRRSHLPIIVDPSHGSARSFRVAPLARAAAAAGADGLLIEVHEDPDRALSDGRQALMPEEFRDLVRDVHAIRRVLEPEPASRKTPVRSAPARND